MERTREFAYEVVDLLKNCPQCTMVFNRFIPSYHHHFGKQCCVSNYGFAKLLELFEAIPETVTVSLYHQCAGQHLYKHQRNIVVSLFPDALVAAFLVIEREPLFRGFV